MFVGFIVEHHLFAHNGLAHYDCFKAKCRGEIFAGMVLQKNVASANPDHVGRFSMSAGNVGLACGDSHDVSSKSFGGRFD